MEQDGPKPTIDFSDYIADRTRDFTGREWVFAAIDKWLAEDGPRTFLLTGGPGSGKTAVAARLVQMSWGEVPTDACPRLGPGRLTFVHFCQALHDRTLGPLRFIEALARQLASRYPTFAQAMIATEDRNITINATQTIGTVADGGQVQNVVIETLQIGNLAARTAFDQLVRRPLEALYASDFDEQIVILVDSLDEALTYNQDENIVTLLGDIADAADDLPAQVRLLLTSRPDQRILKTVGSPALDLIDNAPADVNDVHAYIERRLGALTQSQRGELAVRLANASQGNFLYARYVLDDLLAPGIESARLTLPENLPENLEDIYRQFIKRELGRNQERWETAYRPLLGAIAVARGAGLTRAQLAGAVGLPQSKTDDVLRASAQYLAGPGPNGPYRLYHQSFRDFLLADEEFQVYPAESNQAIAAFFLDEYADGWADCLDDYALRYTPAHLTDAMGQAELKSERRTRTDTLCELLTDFGFLEAKCRQVGVFDLSADLRLALAQITEAHQRRPILALLDQIMRIDGHFLNNHPTSLFQCCWNRGWWYDAPQAVHFYEPPPGGWTPGQAPWDQPGEKMYNFMEGWRAWKTTREPLKRWIRALRPPPEPLGGPQLALLLTEDSDELAVSKDGRILVSGGGNGVLRLWDLSASYAQLAALELGAECYVEVLAFSPDGNSLIAGLGDGSLRFLHPTTLKEQKRIHPGKEAISAAAFSADGRLLVTGDFDGYVRIWDVAESRELANTKAHGGEVASLAFLPGGLEFASGGGGFGQNTVRLWRYTNELVPIDTFELTEQSNVGQIAVAPDGGLLAWTESDGRVILRDLASGASLRFQGRPETLPGSLAFLPSGKHLLCGQGDVWGSAIITCWDIDQQAAIWNLYGHTGGIEALVVYDNGRKLASSGANNDNTIRIWNLEQAGVGASLVQPEMDVEQVLFARTGDLVCTRSEKSGIVFVRSLTDGTLRHRLSGHGGGVVSAALAPDGRLLACCTDEGHVKVWDIAQGLEQIGFPFPESVTGVAFSNDGRLLAAMTEAGSIVLIDVAAKAAIAHLDSNDQSGIAFVGFSRDDRLLAARTWNDSIDVWDISAQQIVNRLASEAIASYSASFTDDNAELVLEGPIEELSALDITSNQPVAVGERHRRAFALAKGRDPAGYRWLLPDPRSAELEMSLVDATGETVSWLPFRFGSVYHHPAGRLWAVLREGQIFMFALEGGASS